MGRDNTQLLKAMSAGDASAAKRLTPLVYDELRVLARRYLRPGSASNRTLEPTALVHEAFLRLVDKKTTDLRSRTHFYALAAGAMRQILIDHVRKQKRAKRGGDWHRITLSDVQAVTARTSVDLVALQEALEKLTELDERAARVVEMRFFAGLTEQAIAEYLDVSERTVRNDWTMARAWLRCELGAEDRADHEDA